MKVKIERIKDYFPCLLIKKRIVPYTKRKSNNGLIM